MDTCTVETGLLRKAPCGHSAVAKCGNCEQPLCTKHAVPQLSATGKKTGAFLCPECNAAQKEFEKSAVQAPVKPAAAAAKPAAAPLKPPPAAAAKPAAEAPKPAEENSDGSIDFTPGKK